MSEDDAPIERKRFAKRLRAIRGPRGFKTARSFAERLDIHENRYTRYERAEVEPDLPLLMQMCDALGVTPNDLLCETIGLSDGPPSRVDYDAPGFAEAGPQDNSGETSQRPVDQRQMAVDMAAWDLASELAQIEETQKALGEPVPAAVIATAGRLFHRLQTQTYAVLPEIGTSFALAKVDLEVQRRVSERIKRLTEALSQSEHTGRSDAVG